MAIATSASVLRPAGYRAVARTWRHLHKTFVESYRPELHYMRGPGPKSREKQCAVQIKRNDALSETDNRSVTL